VLPCQHSLFPDFGVNNYCSFKKKAVNLLARLHGNVCLVLIKRKVLNDKKIN